MKERLAIAIISGCLCMSAANAATPEFVKDGDLNICTTAAFPPMTYNENSSAKSPIGIDIDIATELAKRWNATITYSVTEFSGLLPTLGSGRCDLIISGIYVTDKRREVYDAVKYMKSATVAVVGARNEDIRTPDDLSGKSLALEAGTYYREERVDPLNKSLAAAGKEPVKAEDYPTQQAAYQQVIVGRADATLTEEAEGAFRVAQSGDQLRISYTWPSDFSYGIYMRRDGNSIGDIRALLLELSKDGFFEKLAKKYGLDPSVFAVDYKS